MRAWFYVRTPAASKTLDDGSVDKVYPYASLMKELKPFSKVDPSQEMSEERLACDKAFALACRYSGGRDLVEEMVAADYWPLGRRTDEFTIEMVQVPVFGPPEGLPFPRFGAGIPEDETKESFLDRVEVSTRRIVGKISEKEYLQRRSALGTMPRFNRVFEELGIEYEDYVVPPDVLLGLEKKKDSSKAVAAAEARKRKGGGAVKQLAKKRKAEVVLETPVDSSSARSSAAESNSVASVPAEAAPAGGVPEVEASRAVSSIRAPFASLLGEESSDAEAPKASPARETNPAVAESPAREALDGGGSPPKDGQGESSDEAESVSVRRIKRAEALPRPAGDGINSLYMGKFFVDSCFSLCNFFIDLVSCCLYFFQRMFLLGWLLRRNWPKAPALRRKDLLFLRGVSLRLLRWQVGLRLLMFLVPVLLILRSQVGLMPCARFIPWSEIVFVRSSAAWTLTRSFACNMSTIALYVCDLLYLPSRFFTRRFVVTIYF